MNKYESMFFFKRREYFLSDVKEKCMSYGTDYLTGIWLKEFLMNTWHIQILHWIIKEESNTGKHSWI